MKKFQNFCEKMSNAFVVDVESVENSILDYLHKQKPNSFAEEFKIPFIFYNDGFRFGSSTTTFLKDTSKTYCQKVVNEALKEILEDDRASLIKNSPNDWTVIIKPII